MLVQVTNIYILQVTLSIDYVLPHLKMVQMVLMATQVLMVLQVLAQLKTWFVNHSLSQGLTKKLNYLTHLVNLPQINTLT